MTIEEINLLTIEDVKEILEERLTTSGQELSDKNLSDQLLLYKEELLVIEVERLRVEDWNTRFNNIKDLRMTSYDLGYNIPNLVLWRRKIISSKDETILLALEDQNPITDQRISNEEQAASNKKAKKEAAFIALESLDINNLTTIASIKPVIKLLKEALGAG